MLSQEEQASFASAMRAQGSVTEVELAAMTKYLFLPHTTRNNSLRILLKAFSTGRAAKVASKAVDAAMNVGLGLVHDEMHRRYLKRYDDAVRRSAVSDARAQEACYMAIKLDIVANCKREKEMRACAKLQACERLYLDRAVSLPSSSPSKRRKMHETGTRVARQRISTCETPLIPVIDLTAPLTIDLTSLIPVFDLTAPLTIDLTRFLHGVPP